MYRGKLRPVRGTKDLLGEEYNKFKHIQDIAREIGARYGFSGIQTPIFEFQEVFYKMLGDSSDIVGKEMYTFQDRGGDTLALRPEFTAAIARAFLCENLPVPSKLFTTGPVFRYERPQKCRHRQFHQINYEHFGATHYMSDVEIMMLAYDILCAFGIENQVQLEVNFLGDDEPMKEYKCTLLKYFESRVSALSEDSQRRLLTNPLRIFDSKDARDIAVLEDAPAIADHLSRESREVFEKILEALTDLEIPFIVNNKLVRGLDYYCGTVFEFKTTKLGAQDAVLAGGRYDKLVAMMGGDSVPAIGFAGGLERISALISYEEKKEFCMYILQICEGGETYAAQLAHKLRGAGIKVVCDYTTCSLRSGLRRAGKFADIALIVGESELTNGTVSCKQMETGVQEEISIENVVEYATKYMKELLSKSA